MSESGHAADAKAEAAEQEQKVKAFKITEKLVFKTPAAYTAILQEGNKSYRDLANANADSWHRVTDFEYSAQHWKEGIVSYVNKKAFEVYRNNFYAYRRDLEFTCDSDDEDDPACGPDSPKYKPYEEGAVLIKEHFHLNRDKGYYTPTGPSTATMMVKKAAGYDPKFGDWEYVEWDSSGKVVLAGKASDKKVQARCAKCHAGAEERFFIFSDLLGAGLLEEQRLLHKRK